jgi:hypothetical protein
MYFATPRELNRRFCISATVLLLGLVPLGSAQLIVKGRGLTGYGPTMEQPFLGKQLVPALDAPGGFPLYNLQGTVWTRAAVDARTSEEMFRTLATNTTENVPSRDGSVTFDGIDLTDTATALHRGLLRRGASEANEDQPLTDPSDDDFNAGERYHWGGLLAQSLFFNVIENGVRTASDDQIRTLLAHKPFWHDYVASIHQFNMRRWNDGDDFLVNYVGHPMQGAVSGFIEIQNDPNGRVQEISATHAYWMSRFKAFLWATAYSTHSEISPLGEAGIGNEGGWTYPIHCKTRCTEPGTYKKYTNNTGWVDFIITPTVGSLWLIAEDTLDRFISDRVQGGNRSRILPKILRGGLNPSRTMANALRLKAPWYRDFQHSPDLQDTYGIHFLPSDQSIQEAQNFRRFALVSYFTAMPFGTTAHPCAICLQNPGAGVEADFALARWIAVSFAASKQQDVMSKKTANGSTVNIGLGMRLIYDRPYNTLSLAVRPGFVEEHASISSTSDSSQSSYTERPESTVSHAATTIMLSNDHKISNSVGLRSSFGVVMVRYRNAAKTPPGIGEPPYLSWLSHDSYTTRSTWTYEMGPVFHF